MAKRPVADADDLQPALDEVSIALDRVRQWIDSHPRVADYRLTAAHDGLLAARQNLQHAIAGTHSREWHAARERFRRAYPSVQEDDAAEHKAVDAPHDHANGCDRPFCPDRGY